MKLQQRESKMGLLEGRLLKRRKSSRIIRDGRRAGGDTGAAEGLDVVKFAREKLGFSPDEKQVLALQGGPRVIVNCTRQWGKSTVAAAKAVHRAYTFPGSLVLVVAPSARQSGEFLLKAEDFVRALGLRVKSDGGNDMSIAFPNGSRIIGLPGNEATTRGFSNVKLLIIDEASRVLEEL